ncbi:endo-arabinase [Fusarium bulbicola]|nr:endo-arabinase [Fusarium bulbicola]
MITQGLVWPELGLLLNPVYAGTIRQSALKLTVKHEGTLDPAINTDFPDPSIIQLEDGSWIAVATNGGPPDNYRKLQVATAKDLLGEWTSLQEDALTDKGWTTGENTWAPDIRRIGSEDGVLFEAPNIVRLGNGKYVLFFSSHDFRDPLHNVKYAYADKLSGPYTRAEEPLIAAPDFGLDAPGGATSSEAGDTLVFHGWCPDNKNNRCMYSVEHEYEYE